MTWQAFVLRYGWHARAHHLGYILGQPEADVERFRRKSPVTKGPRRTFGALFTLWHGRPPRDEEWPAPRHVHHGSYEWLQPEYTLIASLVGTMAPAAISQILTARLRRLTGDPTAERGHNATQLAINRIGLQASDIVGGVTMTEAARLIGVRSILYHEIRCGRLPARRVGRYLLIPREAFDRWRASRVFPPKGFVRLAKLRKQLGIRSDKLSEWARAGWIPSAIRCNPTGTRERGTQFGTWYIDPKVAKKILADRRAGRPMPWWGKPELHNLKITWRLYEQRRHPEACETCRQIWGPQGAPTTFDDYVVRYHPLAHGAKKHLTKPWSPGLTVRELAREVGLHPTTVNAAILNGLLRATDRDGTWRISRTDATRWKGRKCPSGKSPKSWLSLAHASRAYSFSLKELRQFIAEGRLKSRLGTFGAEIGITYVVKQQLRELRDELGFSEGEAARRVGVSIARLRVLLRGLEWRPAPRIPAAVVDNCKSRKYSCEGLTITAAARKLGKSAAWVEREIVAGTIRPLRTKWDRKRRYVSAPMFARLVDAARRRRPLHKPLSAEWLLLSDAAQLAGVSATTIRRWMFDGEIKFKPDPRGWRGIRYHKRSVMTRARTYWVWASSRYKRAQPPAWLTAEAA